MKAILVDDEYLSLQILDSMLRELGGVKVVGKYQDQREALAALRTEKPELVFMDIEMPEINGLELAEVFLQSVPSLKIVFITAYNDYAVDAFELNAFDYVLKPISPSRLAKTLERVRRSIKRDYLEVDAGPQPILCCFRQLHFFDPLHGSQYLRWRTTKAQELFAYLLHHRNNRVRKETILEALWLNWAEEKASAHLYTTIYQIRKIIKDKDLGVTISYLDEGYCLRLNGVRLDVEEWEAGIKELWPVVPANLNQHKELMDLYQGDYLEEHHYLWAQSEQERLRIIWLDHVRQVAACYDQIGMYGEAILCYQQILEKYPYAEDICLNLMQAHVQLGNYGEVSKIYRNFIEQLEEDLELKPGTDLVRWYNDCMA